MTTPMMTTTRSGRLVKKPERYEPIEKVEDDFSSDEYDTDDNASDVPSEYTEEEDDDDDSEGSLVDFIVPDEDDSSEDGDD
jgi:hypothetical protein